LFDDGLATQAGEFGAQFDVLRDETLILSFEQVPDLAKRLDVAHLTERPHDAAQ
jgi:hypothetical protein